MRLFLFDVRSVTVIDAFLPSSTTSTCYHDILPAYKDHQLYTLIDNVLFPYATLMTSGTSEVTKYRVTYSFCQMRSTLYRQCN